MLGESHDVKTILIPPAVSSGWLFADFVGDITFLTIKLQNKKHTYIPVTSRCVFF